jgi:REP element-mobilizing transposase RayT
VLAETPIARKRAPTQGWVWRRYSGVSAIAMLPGMTSKPAQSTLRRGRISETGRIYLITFVTWNRAPIFRDYRHARTASRVIHARKTWKGAECLAWVLMPDHFHGLIRLDDGDLSKVVASARSRLTRALRKEGRTYPLWQRAFQDRALREDEDVRAAARYIVANPVRAGLAEHVCLYPYWNAVWL